MVHAQGVKATAASPNAYLFQSLAVLAADMGRVEEARKWFHKGTSTPMARPQSCSAVPQLWAACEIQLCFGVLSLYLVHGQRLHL